MMKLFLENTSSSMAILNDVIVSIAVFIRLFKITGVNMGTHAACGRLTHLKSDNHKT